MAKNDSLKISEDTEEISKPNNIFAELYKKFEKEIKFVLTGGLNTVFDFVIFSQNVILLNDERFQERNSAP